MSFTNYSGSNKQYSWISKNSGFSSTSSTRAYSGESITGYVKDNYGNIGSCSIYLD